MPLRNLTKISIAKWVGAAAALDYNFTHTAFNFKTNQPTNQGARSDAAAAS
eukprot:COSAG02_NODE_42102_length_388_cov_0.397924_1_plen_50_part_10